MAFDNTVLAAIPDLPAGEVIKSAPHCVSAFDSFTDGLSVGRFVKFAANNVSNLDGTATPAVIGIARRKLVGAVGQETYRTLAAVAATCAAFDSVAEVINFGFATVAVPDGVTPAKYGQVYAVNAAASGVNFGKATTVATDNAIVPDCVFWEPKAAGVWLVLMSRYVTGA